MMRNLLWVTLTGLFLLPVSASAGTEFVSLGLWNWSDPDSRARDVSADGSTVVGNSFDYDTFYQSAFVWTRSAGRTEIGDLPGSDFDSIANAVSADGTTVVGAGTVSDSTGYPTYEAYVWTPDTGMVGLGDLPGGGFTSIATGVSADGSTIVGSGESASGWEAFVWTSDSGMMGLGDLAGGSFRSSASGVSADGSIVVGTSTGTLGDEAFLWTADDGMIGLGGLGGASGASAISADGSTVVGTAVSTSGIEAFVWTSGSGMVGLGDLVGGQFRSEAADVSADGEVIVGWSSSGEGLEAFVWDPVNGMRELDDLLVSLGLDLGGWQLTAATGVSDDGRTIVGYGLNPNGQTEAWVAFLPEPKVDLLLMLALTGLVTLGAADGRTMPFRGRSGGRT